MMLCLSNGHDCAIRVIVNCKGEFERTMSPDCSIPVHDVVKIKATETRNMVGLYIFSQTAKYSRKSAAADEERRPNRVKGPSQKSNSGGHARPIWSGFLLLTTQYPSKWSAPDATLSAFSSYYRPLTLSNSTYCLPRTSWTKSDP
jgi:hypothetical protein